MPIFDYQCLQCAHIIEDVLQKLGEEDLRKLLGAANFHLKGDGWYNTPPQEPETTK